MPASFAGKRSMEICGEGSFRMYSKLGARFRADSSIQGIKKSSNMTMENLNIMKKSSAHSEMQMIYNSIHTSM
jgi:hypothetical protein